MEREEYLRLYELEDELWWFRGMREVSLTLLERFTPASNPPSRRVLDAGCGTGGMLAALRRFGHVTGLDESSDAVRLASRRAEAPIVRGSVSALPFATGSFDVATSFDVLYHLGVADDEGALAEIARVTRSGGTVLVRVPAYDRLRSRHDEAVHTRQRYGRRELTDKIRRAGLEPVFVSFANSLLFPLALVRRSLERARSPRRRGSEVEPIFAPLNALFFSALRLEARWLRRFSLPFGLSLVAVARKTHGNAPRPPL